MPTPFAPRRRLILGGAAALAAPALLRARPATAQPTTRTIVDTLAATPNFDTLVGMIGRAGFTDQLRGPGPLTVFAPTDQAFVLMPATLQQDLLAQGSGGGGSGTGGGGGTLSGASPDFVRLRALLEYHAIRGLYRAADLRPDMRLATVNGNEVQVVAAPNGGLALVNPAPATQSLGFGAGGLNVMPPAAIIRPDMVATNGIIHTLGGVLLP